MKRALFVGRFQPFHKGHLSVIRNILNNYDEAIIVVGSAEESLSNENPFTAGERIEMIRRCLNDSRVIIVPVRDINNNSLWVPHLLSYLPKFDAVYSNNELVKILFSRYGIPVKGIKFHERKKHEGKTIRKQMLKGNLWKKHIPKPASDFIEEIKGIERIRRIAKI